MTASDGHVYTAVLDDGVRTPDQFQAWLARHDS